MSRVRDAQPGDVPVLLRLVHELAVYEREPEAVQATADDLHRALFVDGTCSALVALGPTADLDGSADEVVGFALWYPTFSTWTGRSGLWLEDLFVRPGARGSGLGRTLLQALATVCVDRGWPRFEWWVLDWNTPAIGFYESLGAVAQGDWTTFRVDGAALAALAGGAPDDGPSPRSGRSGARPDRR